MGTIAVGVTIVIYVHEDIKSVERLKCERLGDKKGKNTYNYYKKFGRLWHLEAVYKKFGSFLFV